MNDETKKWVTNGHSPEDQASLLKQIGEDESLGKVSYFISVPGCYYEIEIDQKSTRRRLLPVTGMRTRKAGVHRRNYSWRTDIGACSVVRASGALESGI
jgi:hypothetical protein